MAIQTNVIVEPYKTIYNCWKKNKTLNPFVQLISLSLNTRFDLFALVIIRQNNNNIICIPV